MYDMEGLKTRELGERSIFEAHQSIIALTQSIRLNQKSVFISKEALSL
jgi:hypothetical protein